MCSVKLFSMQTAKTNQTEHMLIIPPIVNPLFTDDPKVSSLANSEDPAKMPHNTTFRPGLHCLLSKNDIRRKSI